MSARAVDQWLRDLLRYGPTPAVAIYAEAAKVGYSRDRTRRARERIGAVPNKTSMSGGWQWRLGARTIGDDGDASVSARLLSPPSEPSSGNTAAGAAARSHFSPNDSRAQRQRILERLQQGSATTMQLRHELDVLMPGARIHELRHRNKYNICLTWVEAESECGRPHRVGLFTLRPGQWNGSKGSPL